MTATEAQRAYASLYSQNAESLRTSLPEMGEGLEAQLVDLHKRPCVAAAEQVAANLDGARRAVLRFRERLIAEGTGDGQ